MILKSFGDFNQVVRVLLTLSSSKRCSGDTKEFWRLQSSNKSSVDTFQVVRENLTINQVVRVQGDVNGSEDWKEYGYQ